jgi:hypothetical protein
MCNCGIIERKIRDRKLYCSAQVGSSRPCRGGGPDSKKKYLESKDGVIVMSENHTQSVFGRENLPCVKCGSRKHEKTADYCEQCGATLEGNYCTNRECKRCLDRNPDKEFKTAFGGRDFIIEACSPDALFCPDCGSKTTFQVRGVLIPPNS